MVTTKQELKAKKDLSIAYNDYQKGLIIFAFFKVSDQALSEDLVQDTFIKTWKYLIKGGEIEMMKAFLYHVLHNLIIDQYRKQKTTSIDLLAEKGFEPSINPSQRLYQFLDGKTAILFIHKLPHLYRKVMYMRYVQNLSIEEMALATGQSKNSITVQAHRGLEKLKMLYNRA